MNKFTYKEGKEIILAMEQAGEIDSSLSKKRSEAGRKGGLKTKERLQESGFYKLIGKLGAVTKASNAKD